MRGKPITVRLFVPSDGKYIPFESMSETEKATFGRRCAARMGNAMNDYFNQHIEQYQKI